jgi:hypothetical protein
VIAQRENFHAAQITFHHQQNSFRAKAHKIAHLSKATSVAAV